MDDCAEEGVAIVRAGEGVKGAVGGDELDGGDRGGEVLIVNAGAVGCGGGGSRYGDVGKGGEIVEGEAFGVDDGGEVTVADPGAYGYGAGLFVEGNLVEVLERDLGLGAVGDGVEGVACAEGAEFGVIADELLELRKGGGLEEIGGV